MSEKHFNISIVPVRSRGGSLVITICVVRLILYVFYFYLLMTDWRNGLNTRLLRKRLRVRSPHITMYEHVCLY
jgi:hypothetical protein